VLRSTSKNEAALDTYQGMQVTAPAQAPKPPEQAPAGIGTAIDSTPQGAAILVNGMMTGLVTPATVALVRDQSNEVTLALDGFDVLTTRIQGDGTRQTVVLGAKAPSAAKAPGDAPGEPLVSRLRIEPRSGTEVVTNVRVFVNGVERTSARPLDLEVEPDRPCHITLRAEGFADTVVMLTPRASRSPDDWRLLAVPMARESVAADHAVLRLEVSPPTAEVRLDGTQVAPRSDTQVSRARLHRLRIEATGYVPVDKVIAAGAGFVVLPIGLESLQREPSAISLKVSPEDTRIYLRSTEPGGPSAVEIGRGEVKDFATPAGAYEVVLGRRDEKGRQRGTFAVTLLPATKHVIELALDGSGVTETAASTAPLPPTP
jgi:hypothetical protein